MKMEGVLLRHRKYRPNLLAIPESMICLLLHCSTRHLPLIRFYIGGHAILKNKKPCHKYISYVYGLCNGNFIKAQILAHQSAFESLIFFLKGVLKLPATSRGEASKCKYLYIIVIRSIIPKQAAGNVLAPLNPFGYAKHHLTRRAVHFHGFIA
jgi:hypothetical protein